jgi:hypothetical protein
VWYTTVISALGRLGQEDFKFKASLARMSPCLPSVPSPSKRKRLKIAVLNIKTVYRSN